MFEHIVQMGPMLVLAGVMAGWVAEVVSRADGHGFIRDMVLGLVGSVVGARPSGSSSPAKQGCWRCSWSGAEARCSRSSLSGGSGALPSRPDHGGRVGRRAAGTPRPPRTIGLFGHDR